MTPGQNDLGFPEQGSQQLSFPAVPDPGANRHNVADRQHKQHFQPFERLHDGAETFNGARIGQVAALRDGGHIEVMGNQPRHRLGLAFIQAKARAQNARHAFTGDGMIFGPSFGNVMQEDGHRQHFAIADGGQDFIGHRQIIFQQALVKGRQNPDRTQQMLVDRVVMIHVELHHRDDAPELRHKAAEQAGFIHPPQQAFGGFFRIQNFNKQPVGFFVFPQVRRDKTQRLGDQPRRIRMDHAIQLIGKPEQAQQIDRVFGKNIGPRNADAVPDQNKITRIGNGSMLAFQAVQHALQNRLFFGVARLQSGTDNGCQIAHVFCNQKIALHKALDR